MLNPVVEAGSTLSLDSSTSSPIPSPTSTPKISTLDFTKTLEQYNNIEVSIVYENLKTKERAEINPNIPRIGASTTKLVTAIYILNQIEKGKIKFDDKLGNYNVKFQFQQLINQSNNISWELFLDLGGRNNISNYAKNIGIKDFDISKNTITANDMAHLLKRIYQKELLSEENTQYLISLMKNTEDDTFVSHTKEDLNLFHKNGKLDGVVNEAIIYNKENNPFVLAIYTDGKEVMKYEERRKLFYLIIDVVLENN
ncbi:MAG: class A beta-lactamase-related serine hydrolase [bacterium]|nr:class A beta-lactamase-related serine hydrolase [bacterium]